MPESICDKITDYLVRNRVSTTEVADALGKTGVVPDLMPINRGHYKAGKIKWVYAYDESNWPVHEQMQDLEEDNIVFVDAFNCGNRAIFGGGGLGKIAINYGYYRYKYLVMFAAVILLIVLVQVFQSVGTHLAVKTDKRLKR